MDPTTPPSPVEAARTELRAGLTDAMRDRDRVAVAALRSGLSALDQAEAIPVADSSAEPAVGLGAGEVARRELTTEAVRRTLQAEVDERRRSAEQLRAVGQEDAARTVEQELATLARYL